MTVFYSNELDPVLNATPARKAKGSAVGGRMRREQATIDLASQATTDTIVIASVPKGQAFAYGVLNSSVTLGAATIAVGITGATGKYRAAAVFTAVSTPTLFGVNAALGDGAELAAAEEIFITIATAALPASGRLVVDLYFSGA